LFSIGRNTLCKEFSPVWGSFVYSSMCVHSTACMSNLLIKKVQKDDDDDEAYDYGNQLTIEIFRNSS